MNIDTTLIDLGSYNWIFIPLGLFLGLLGYHMFRISLLAVGVFFGFMLGDWLGHNVLENVQMGQILGLVVGVILGLSVGFFLKVGLFLMGAAGGIVLATVIIPNLDVSFSPMEFWLWRVVAALVGGLLTVPFYKILVVALTSLLGAYMVYVGTVSFFPPGGNLSWIKYIYVVLLVVFLIVQIGSRRRGRHDILPQRGRRY